MTKKYKIAGLTGSLRNNSISGKFLAAVAALASEAADLTEIRYNDVPVFNQDLEFPTPASVAEVREAVKAADALVIVMAEYNLSIPGPLKNLLDWLSRPEVAGQPKPSLDKPILVFSLSAGMSGGMVPQESLRSVLGYLGGHVMPQPRASFTGVYNLLDDHGNLKLYDASQHFLKISVDTFIDYIGKFTK